MVANQNPDGSSLFPHFAAVASGANPAPASKLKGPHLSKCHGVQIKKKIYYKCNYIEKARCQGLRGWVEYIFNIVNTEFFFYVGSIG